MKIFIVHATAGAGHLKAAEALYQAFLKNKTPEMQVVKIDALDHTNALFKAAYPAVYIFLVRHASILWGLFFHFLNCRPLKPLINVIRHFFNSIHGRNFVLYIEQEQPDVVICEHFFSAELVSHLKQSGRFKGQVICGITDFGVHQFWINKGTDTYFVASEMTKEELVQKGISEGKIHVTGIPVEEKFSRNINKEDIYKKLGLDTKKLTVLVTSGGFGVGPVKKIVSCLDQTPRDLQMLVICGKNSELLDFFKAQSFKKRVNAFGYVDNMEEFMEVADLIISKSGGLTVSESLVKGLPMIIIKPIPGQEMRNAEVIEKYNIGIKLDDVNDVAAQVERLLKDDAHILKQMRENALKLAKPQAAIRMCQWVMDNSPKKS